MIGSLLVALQIAVATPSVLSVRAAGAETAVPLVSTNVGAAVPIEKLAPVVPLSVRRLDNGHFAVSLPGLQLDVADQVPFTRVGNSVVPLASAPFVSGGRLLMPFQVIADLLPRFAPSLLRYNAARGELRLLGAGAEPAMIPASANAVKRSAPSRPGGRGRRRRVVVDAGHGGPDNGMSGPIGARSRVHEKDITLAVAKKLEQSLENRGVDVVMTRTTDTLIALSDRGRIANEQHGDVFVSIHVNAANLAWKRPADARGFETYFLAEAKTADARRVEEMENASVHFETGASAEKDDPLAFIKMDMAQNEHLRESGDLASRP
jgi:N-acetylmuramoyl-L-alanine amidase